MLMFRRTKLLVLAALAVGGLLGYAAASGKLNPFELASASPPLTEETNPTFDCCIQPATKNALLTLVAHNQSVETKAAQADRKPNILVIWGDDIGYWNSSCYNRGMMGYKTPNIDRIAKEGALFTDCYAQQSCTAGRGAFITGQSPFRTGLLKVGLPGAKEGLSDKDPTLAELLPTAGLRLRPVRQEPPR
jgi:hypothetical protein